MRFIDLFAGVGGFRLGMERADHECVWSCESDRWCRAVYKYRFGDEPAGDARKVDAWDIPDHDCLCAGFPCQSFSVAGRRRGLEDTRGTLFHEICRVAEAKRPQLLLLENVKGLLSSSGGRDFGVILESLGELGYDVEWQVLNSKDFGVPQNRERVFIVGHLGGFGGRQVFPLRGGGGEHDGAHQEAQGEGSRVRGEDCASTVDKNYWKGGGSRTSVAEGETMIYRHPMNYGKRSLYQGNETHPSLRTVSRKPSESFMIHNIYGGFGETEPRIFEGISPTIRTPKGGGPLPMVVADRTRTYADLGRNLESPKPMTNALSGVQKDNLVVIPEKYYYTEKELETIRERKSAHPDIRWKSGIKGEGAVPFPDDPDRPARTITGSEGRPNRMTHGIPSGMRIRRLTPKECERLQSYPDDFTRWGIDEKGEVIEISDTQRYKMMGNAVTVSVVEAVARRLRL